MAVTVASAGAFFRSGSAADRGAGVLPSEAARRNATRSARARASGRPEAHEVPRHRLLGIRDPRIERTLVPHDAGFPERRRISPKGLERARLAAQHAREARTGHVAVRLEGMAGGARLEYSRAPRRIARVLRSRRCSKRQ